MIATGCYLCWDWYLRRAQNSPHPPAWSQKEEYVRLPLACFGGPLIVSAFISTSSIQMANLHP